MIAPLSAVALTDVSSPLVASALAASRPNGRPTPAAHARFEALRQWRNAKARERGVEPDIVLNNQALWAIALRNPRSPQELLGDGLLAEWQVEEYGDEVLAVVVRAR